jgi:hypothetical protein
MQHGVQNVHNRIQKWDEASIIIIACHFNINPFRCLRFSLLLPFPKANKQRSKQQPEASKPKDLQE